MMVAAEVVGVLLGVLMTVEALTVVFGPLMMPLVVVDVEGGAGVAGAGGARLVVGVPEGARRGEVLLFRGRCGGYADEGCRR